MSDDSSDNSQILAVAALAIAVTGQQKGWWSALKINTINLIKGVFDLMKLLILFLLKWFLILGGTYLLVFGIYKLCIYIKNKVSREEFEDRLKEMILKQLTELRELKSFNKELRNNDVYLSNEVYKLKKHIGLISKEKVEEVATTWDQA